MKYSITFGIKSLKCLIGHFCRLMLFAWDNKPHLKLTQKWKSTLHLTQIPTACSVKRKINTKEENDPHFVPPVLGSLTWYCWPCWELRKPLGFPDPCRAWSQTVCPGKVCKQHHQSREGGVVQGETSFHGAQEETTAALRPKVSSKYGQWREAMVGLGRSEAVSLLQPSPWASAQGSERREGE